MKMELNFGNILAMHIVQFVGYCWKLNQAVFFRNEFAMRFGLYIHRSSGEMNIIQHPCDVQKMSCFPCRM